MPQSISKATIKPQTDRNRSKGRERNSVGREGGEGNTAGDRMKERVSEDSVEKKGKKGKRDNAMAIAVSCKGRDKNCCILSGAAKQNESPAHNNDKTDGNSNNNCKNNSKKHCNSNNNCNNLSVLSVCGQCKNLFTAFH